MAQQYLTNRLPSVLHCSLNLEPQKECSKRSCVPAESSHKQSTTAEPLPVDLQLVVGAWERLPNVVRAAIVDGEGGSYG